MAGFETPKDLSFNRGLIADPKAFARDQGAASWLFLCGPDFADMDGGMSYAQVEAAVPESDNIIADPPHPFDMETVRHGIAALDRLPRPTLVTCRTGPRSSALVYVYAGVRSGAAPADVLATADADNAPFTQAEPLPELVVRALEQLAADST